MSRRFTKRREKKVLLKGTYLLEELLEKAAGHCLACCYTACHCLACCLTWLSTAWLAAWHGLALLGWLLHGLALLGFLLGLLLRLYGVFGYHYDFVVNFNYRSDVLVRDFEIHLGFLIDLIAVAETLFNHTIFHGFSKKLFIFNKKKKFNFTWCR